MSGEFERLASAAGADAVLPMDEAMRMFAGHGADILGPPLSLSDFA